MFGLSSRTEARTIDPSSWGQAWGDPWTTDTWSGSVVNQTTAMQMLTVYGCVKFIADGISTLPIDEYRDRPDGTKQEIDPKTGWLEKPTPDLDRIAWTTQVLTSLLLAGNAYLWVQRTSPTDAIVTPLDPQKVRVYRQNGHKAYLLNGAPTGNMEIKHIPGLMLAGTDIGLSPVEMARQTLGSGMGAEEYAARQFGQSMSMSGVLESPGPALTADQARDLARQLVRQHGGKNKAGLPAVLSGGMTWKPISITNDQAQFLQTRQFTAAQIASMMFMIDPTEFGLSMDKGSSITYANLEQRNARKVTVTFLPWIVRLERAMSEILAGTRHVKYNVSGLLRGDLKTRYESYLIASQINTASAGQPVFLGTAEMREFEDMEPTTEMAPEPPKPAAPVTPMVVNNNMPPFNIDARSNVDARTDARSTIDARSNIEAGAIAFTEAPTTVSLENHPDAVIETMRQLVLDLPAPIVNIAPTEVRVDAPIVNIPAPIVNVAAPEKRKTTRTIKRDREGRIAQVIED